MSNSPDPLTDTDLRRWQLARYRILGEILTFGEQHRLPPLTWTLGVYSLALTGNPTSYPDPERRGLVETWAQELGLPLTEERGDFGRVHLRASGYPWGQGVQVVVRADVWEDHPAD